MVYKITIGLMILWTLLMGYSILSSVTKEFTHGPITSGKVSGTFIAAFIWFLMWLIPMIGLGILALATKPKKQDKP